MTDSLGMLFVVDYRVDTFLKQIDRSTGQQGGSEKTLFHTECEDTFKIFIEKTTLEHQQKTQYRGWRSI